MPSALTTNAHRPFGERVTIDFVETRYCEHCGRPKAVKTRTGWHPYVDLDANKECRSTRRHCGDPFCPGYREYETADVPDVPPKADFSYAVQAMVCELRWRYKHTYEEIVAEMSARFQIEMSLNTVENFLRIYEMGCALKYRPVVVEKMRANGGIILTIDGMAPLRGRQGLYVAYDHLTGQTLGARKLPNQRQDTIADFLETIKTRVEGELRVPVLAVVSDALPSQRLAIERVFPGVPHCLCHYHFFNLVLLAPKTLDSHVVTQVRAALRELYYMKKYKDRKAGITGEALQGDFVDHVLEGLLELANWRRRRKDPCFTSLELVSHVADLRDVLGMVVDKINAGTTRIAREREIRKLHETLDALVAAHAGAVAELARVKSHLETLSAILGDLECSFNVGLKRLRRFRDGLRKNRFSPKCGPAEREFVEALMKFVRTKGEHLFNYKRVPGAPTTNNSHELHYKQLKHLLRRVIGHAAANEYLLAHGERMVFVNPGESSTGIVEILREVDQTEARRQIAAERKSRESMVYIIHDEDKWADFLEHLQMLAARL